MPTYPTQHPKIYLSANRTRLSAALAASTPAAQRFKTIVDGWVGGTSYWGFQTWNAALLGQLTGDPKYCTAAIASVEAQVATAEATIATGGTPVVAADSYLDIGGMIGDVALVYDWCYDAVSSSQRTRWLAYANQAVWNVWHPAQAVWGGAAQPWSGWATNDPADNYYYSFLRATMLLGLAAHGEDPQADTWIAQFHDTKLMGQLVPTFDADLVGGGSREGTGYGVSMRSLWMMYRWWEDTTGERLAKKTPHTHASLLNFLHQIVPTLDRFAPTGDQSRDSTASLFDYQRDYLEQLVTLYPHDVLSGRAQALLAACSVPAMQDSFNAVFDFIYDSTVPTTALDGGTAYFAQGIGQLYARSGWDAHATWLNLIAGPYTESHAHQDQGSLMLYKDGWLAWDAVIDSHSGLRQEADAHGLVRLTSGGASIAQHPDSHSQLVALHAGDGWLYAAADLTAAYDGDARIARVQRELVYLQPDVVVVYDRVTTTADTQQVWQLAMPAAPALAGTVATEATAGHALAIQRLAPGGAASSVHDFTTDATGDYGGGYRLDETMAGGDNRFLHVISIDGAAKSVVSNDDSSVTVQLAGGGSATIQFAHDVIGATLVTGGSTITLDASVDTLPE